MRNARTVAAVKAQTVLNPHAGAPAVWRPLGPSPLASDASGFGQQDYSWVAGRATSVVVDRADASGNTVYAGGAYGGLWKSTNAGALSQDPANVIWTPLIDDQPTLAVGTIAIQPQTGSSDPSHSVVLVGTGETNSSIDSYYGLGILRSNDAGLTWTLISKDSTGTRAFSGLGFSKIAFSNANPNLVVAATAGASQGQIEGLANPPTANLGLYYSTNGGLSWTYATVKDGSTTVAPSSVTTVTYNDGAGLFFAAIRFHGFYSSSDGINWTRLASQPGPGLSALVCTTNPSSQSCPIYRGEIATVPGRNEMYAWYVDANDNNQGIWQSLNGGTHWTQISTTSIDACGDMLDGCGTENGTYNLALAAMPDGATATNLYAGAVNLYKCRINSQSLSCNGPNTFLNLTHVYGCAPNFGVTAHVHPAQHAIDWLVVNGKALLYFANDGGIYRALDGYTGLTSGDCGSANQFDSLNQTLGSMTQFISFAQHPTDTNTLLGGAQGNGSPATAEALVTAGWRNVNSGDGGHTAINPANPSEWFTSNPGVNIQRCALGVQCHSQDFDSQPVVTSATLDGDSGPFYTPYILDPQNPNRMIVGTCRVWQGQTYGTGFNVLSNDLDTGSSSICSGNEANLVRSLAAGGPTDTNHSSQVIYAGTDGYGPLVTTIPAAGRLWVTTNASNGAPSWSDRTSVINPHHFPISSIAMDNSDASGNTAYVAIMGFHTAHVWMTPSAGVSWFDFTGNLPDIPVNTLVVDPGLDSLSGTVYAGTDIGVYARSTASLNTNWTEVGPATGSGFLPNVPVTELRIFQSGSTKLLRASTYGRGLWQFPLTTAADFQIAIPNPIQTIFASQTAFFSGALTEFNDYDSLVNFSCVTGSTPPPSVCSASPAAVTPSATGAGFSLTAGGAVGDYSFVLHAAGSDPSVITHDTALTLHVIDFGLSTPNPSGTGINPGETSPVIALEVTAQGRFQGTISFFCSGLPTSTTCNFSPSSTTPVAGSPVPISLTISSSSSTLPGIYTIAIHAATAGSPDKTQTFTLIVGKLDYAISIANPSLTAIVNSSATFNGLLSTSSGYGSSVNLSCGPGAPPNCSISPLSITPGGTGTPFTVAVGSNTAHSYSFTILAQGTDVLAISHSIPANFQSIFDFTISATPDSRTTRVGQPASYSLDLAPQGGSFLTPVDLSCSGLPAKTSCTFSPSQVASGNGETTVMLAIATSAPSIAAASHHTAFVNAFWFPCLALALGGITLRSQRKRILPGICSLFLFLILLSACGGGLEGNGAGGPAPGTTPGTYIISVTASAGTVSHSMTVTLTVQ